MNELAKEVVLWLDGKVQEAESKLIEAEMELAAMKARFQVAIDYGKIHSLDDNSPAGTPRQAIDNAEYIVNYKKIQLGEAKKRWELTRRAFLTLFDAKGKL